MIASPTVADLVDELVARELDPETGDRLELVERPTGVAQATSAHLPERHTAGGHEGADDEGRFVPHTARRVLVRYRAADLGLQVDRVAASHHRVRERVRLASVQAAEIDGHAERRELVVGDLVTRVPEDEVGELRVGELPAVPLPLDEFCRADHLSATKTQGVRRARIGPSTSGTEPDSTTIEST